MVEYWFIVKSTNEALYEGLREVLAGRPGFHLIKERRGGRGQPPSTGERRMAQTWQAEEIAISETST